MTQDPTPRSRLSELYAEKRKAGLVSVKFFIGNVDEASFEDVAEDVLKLEEAVQRGECRPLRFNDKH